MVRKINFTGNFWEYFAVSIVLVILSFVTLGLVLPYYVYWSAKYFFSHLEIEE